MLTIKGSKRNISEGLFSIHIDTQIQIINVGTASNWKQQNVNSSKSWQFPDKLASIGALVLQFLVKCMHLKHGKILQAQVTGFINTPSNKLLTASLHDAEVIHILGIICYS